MPFAVEMYFDRESEQRIRALSDRCSGFGDSTVVKETRPHISLAVADGVVQEKIEALLLRTARDNKPFEITLSAMGFFAVSPLIAYLAPKVDRNLLDLHARFLEGLTDGASGIWGHYRPRSWIPHCTLASGLTAQQSSSVLEEVQRFGLPLVCRMTEIGLIRFRPVVPIFCTALAGSP